MMSKSRGWFATAVLAALCAVLLLPGLGGSIVRRQQELRVLLSARDMAEGGSWLVPHFMGEERLRKPPLMNWAVAAAFRLDGSTENVSAARRVSSIAGIALVLATFLWGRRLIGSRAAFLGALVLLTSIGFVRHARLAETDIAQALFCSLSAFSLFAAISKPRSGRTGPWLRDWAMAGLFSGIGFMVKGPASVVMPAAAAAAYGVVSWRRRRSGRVVAPISGLRWPVGAVLALVVCVAIAAPWYIVLASRASEANAQVGDEVARLLSESVHKGPFLYYLWTLPARMGLWALAVPMALFAAATRLWHHRGPRFILCWLATSTLILSLLSSKQAHYALLLFVPAALLVGWLLSLARRRSRAFLPTFAHWHLLAMCLAAFCVGIAIVVCWLRAYPITWPAGFAASGALLAGAAVVAARAVYARRFLAAPLALLVVTFALGAGYIEPRAGSYFENDAAVVEFSRANRQTILQAPAFHAIGPHAYILTWYAHRVPDMLKGSCAEAWRGLQPGDVLFCSSRGAALDLGGIDATPVATCDDRDAHVALFVKGPAHAP